MHRLILDVLRLLADLATGPRRNRCAHVPSDRTYPPACGMCGLTLTSGG